MQPSLLSVDAKATSWQDLSRPLDIAQQSLEQDQHNLDWLYDKNLISDLDYQLPISLSKLKESLTQDLSPKHPLVKKTLDSLFETGLLKKQTKAEHAAFVILNKNRPLLADLHAKKVLRFSQALLDAFLNKSKQSNQGCYHIHNRVMH